MEIQIVSGTLRTNKMYWLPKKEPSVMQLYDLPALIQLWILKKGFMFGFFSDMLKI